MSRKEKNKNKKNCTLTIFHSERSFERRMPSVNPLHSKPVSLETPDTQILS